MKIFFLLLGMTLAFAARGQTLINLPGSMFASVTFNQMTPEGPNGLYFQGNLYGTLTNSKEPTDHGAITCISNHGLSYLTALGKFGNESKSGNFQFSSWEKCVEVGNALAQNPGRPVTFKVNLSSSDDYIGQVVSVRWN